MSFTGVTFTETNIQRLFGNEAAENEQIDVLRSYYFKGKAYEQLSEQLPLRILVGHKGVGKSALFKIAFDEDAEKGCLPVFIKPDDILNLANQENGNLLSLIRDWKQGLVEIVSRKILTEFHAGEVGANVAVNLTTRFFSGILDSINFIKEKINLDPARQSLLTNFTQNKKVVVYLDDLDRGWEGRAVDIKRISALLNAARDLSSDNPGLMFRIALRTDVYFLVRTSDESTDKVGSSVIWYSWSNHEIYILLVKRILSFYNHRQTDESLLNMSQHELSIYLDRVMATRFNGHGKWRDIPTYRMLMSLIRKRPRDLVKLCTLAARQAYLDNATKIETRHFSAVFEEYSQDRIQDTINEFRTELPQVERLLLEMKPSRKQKTTRLGYYYSTADLLAKIKHIATTAGGFKYSYGYPAGEKELLHFLYKINFLTARKNLLDGKIQRKDFEHSRYISSKFSDFGYGWEVHPAYRWALQPDDIDSIYDDLGE